MLIKNKSDEQKYEEAKIIHDFRGNPNNAAHREAAETILWQSHEQLKELNDREERYYR